MPATPPPTSVAVTHELAEGGDLPSETYPATSDD
jgi:hypothetical protein